jgi:hypothetical protein
MLGKKLKKSSNKEKMKERKSDKEVSQRQVQLSQSGVRDRPVGKLLISTVFKH